MEAGQQWGDILARQVLQSWKPLDDSNLCTWPCRQADISYLISLILQAFYTPNYCKDLLTVR